MSAEAVAPLERARSRRRHAAEAERTPLTTVIEALTTTRRTSTVSGARSRIRPNRVPSSSVSRLGRFIRPATCVAATPRLLASRGSVEPRIERYWRVVYELIRAVAVGTSAGEHADTPTALARGTAATAQHAGRTTWRHSADRLGSAVEYLGERGTP